MASLVSTGPPVNLVLPAVTLNVGVVRAGSRCKYVTPGQDLTMSQTGGSGPVDWIALRDVPWLSTSPTFGTGPGVITFSVNASAASLAPGTYTGHIWIYTDGTVDPALVPVRLTVRLAGTARTPDGVVDTPINGLKGVTGSMGVTGWAIDDVGVKQVRILRAPTTGEGTRPIFIGNADLVDGARPDVAALYSTSPFNTRAGWGFMILTNMLPRQGNGWYTLYAYADDFDGHSTLLGSRTIACDNAHSILPFGAIDTPSQGGTASGSPFVNFGWVLASSGQFIPFDGHTIEAFIDSVSIGTLDTYNNARSDIQRLFPGYANTNGAVGAKFFDTTAMSNGLHTLAWVAKDDVGHTQGIRSRFFKVFNQSGLYLDGPAPAAALPAAVSADRAAARLPAARIPFAGTLVLARGWSATEQPNSWPRSRTGCTRRQSRWATASSSI